MISSQNETSNKSNLIKNLFLHLHQQLSYNPRDPRRPPASHSLHSRYPISINIPTTMIWQPEYTSLFDCSTERGTQILFFGTVQIFQVRVYCPPGQIALRQFQYKLVESGSEHTWKYWFYFMCFAYRLRMITWYDCLLLHFVFANMWMVFLASSWISNWIGLNRDLDDNLWYTRLTFVTFTICLYVR